MSDQDPEPYDTRRHLIEGLVGGHRDAYRNSPSFRAEIEMLANLLPLWVKGMAAEAKSNDLVYAKHRALQQIELSSPRCLCGHTKIQHTGDSHCLGCPESFIHAFEPRWVLIQCETWVPEMVARKTGFPMSPTGSRCLKEKDHDPALDQHVAVDGNQWVAWT